MKKNLVFSVVLLLAGCVHGFAQKEKIVIETQNAAIVFSVKGDGKLYQTYFGEKLMGADAYAQLSEEGKESYIPAGTNNLFEPAIRMVHADGNPSLELKYESSKTDKQGDVSHTSIVLKDNKYPVTVVLHFESYFKENTFKEWTEITQNEKKEVQLTRYASSMLHFSANDYWLTQFHGDWAAEMRIQESKLTNGIKTIDTKLGTRADMYATPTFFLALNKQSDETSGEVIAGTLAWTGNFQFTFDVDEKNDLRVISGINPFASEYSLKSGEVFTTPAFIFTYSHNGKGEASRSLHAWARNYGVLDGNGSRLTLLNNWESTQFDFDEKKLSGLFADTKKLGVDMFLLDDGWFANKYPRNDDHAGLGDWQENKAKLPNGLGHLVKDAESKGVKFGIWIEPEMVNPKSELYEKHPDWILKLPNRDEDYFRNQLVLDLTNPVVKEFVYNMVDDMMTKNPGIAYIKWDCNRMMTNTYSPYLKNKQSHVYIEYVRSLYSILERLRQKYPTLPIMLCSGGGGRTDYGALKYFTEFWPSDNTNAVDRVFIQWGYSYFFPANTIANHITSWGKQSLKYRTDVAMMGRLGYDIDVEKMSPDEFTFSQDAVKNYKRLSDVIWHGNLYKLVSPYDESRAVLMFSNDAKTKAVVFAYNLNFLYGKRWEAVKLQGLDPAKKYTIKETNLYPGHNSSVPENGKTFTGDYLMKVGINPSSDRELTSTVIEITEAP
ncbi:alpha-galactosidase [Pinibacter aurantiacus]|uniref:Alpha-galactosidase n=1 Tax=Pinibacter aurantiacus TaxID=2851599 RepID=A0A9E2SBP3_9BACT|nr:alpha-galactosidase [Pinibacter aurantiacus]MBV4357440.1 alpha-galactosidase [Pinibacter aurantiacus]